MLGRLQKCILPLPFVILFLDRLALIFARRFILPTRFLNGTVQCINDPSCLSFPFPPSFFFCFVSGAVCVPLTFFSSSLWTFYFFDVHSFLILICLFLTFFLRHVL